MQAPVPVLRYRSSAQFLQEPVALHAKHPVAHFAHVTVPPEVKA